MCPPSVAVVQIDPRALLLQDNDCDSIEKAFPKPHPQLKGTFYARGDRHEIGSESELRALVK
jgi:hypothetical protein